MTEPDNSTVTALTEQLQVAALRRHHVLFVGDEKRLYGFVSLTRAMLEHQNTLPLAHDDLERLNHVQFLCCRGPASNDRPYRAPHYSAHVRAFVRPEMGELNLSRYGALVLTDMLEFMPSCLHAISEYVTEMYGRPSCPTVYGSAPSVEAAAKRLPEELFDSMLIITMPDSPAVTFAVHDALIALLPGD